MVANNDSACLNYIWEWSIHYGSLSVMFTPLHSSMNQKKSTSVQCNHYEKYNSAVCPRYRLKLKYPFSFPVSYVCLTCYTALWINNCLNSTSVIKVATMKYGGFTWDVFGYAKEAIMQNHQINAIQRWMEQKGGL